MVTRLHGDPRSCPTGCGRTVRPGHLMCAACWREVPKAEQRDVWRTWRTFQRVMTDDAWDAYQTARTAALTAIGATP